MWTCPAMLAQQDDSMGQLAYVIAILVLALLGALADKLKRKTGEAPPRGQDRRPGRQSPTTGRDSAESSPWREILSPPTPPVAGRPAAPKTPPVARRPRKVRPPQPAVARPASPVPEPEEVPGRLTLREIGTLTGPAAVPKVAPRTGAEPPPTGTVPPAPQATPRPVTVRPAFALIGPVDKLPVGELRRAVVWSEILQPPVATREPFS